MGFRWTICRGGDHPALSRQVVVAKRTSFVVSVTYRSESRARVEDDVCWVARCVHHAWVPRISHVAARRFARGSVLLCRNAAPADVEHALRFITAVLMLGLGAAAARRLAARGAHARTRCLGAFRTSYRRRVFFVPQADSRSQRNARPASSAEPIARTSGPRLVTALILSPIHRRRHGGALRARAWRQEQGPVRHLAGSPARALLGARCSATDRHGKTTEWRRTY
jgi:hypothetical protein